MRPSTAALFHDYPEVRVHLAHLRALHYQRKSRGSGHTLPKLKARPPEHKRIKVRIPLSPEVLHAFQSTEKDWQHKINEVLLALVKSDLAV